MNTKRWNMKHVVTALIVVMAIGLFTSVQAQVTLLDDLEAGGNQNKFLGYWYFYTDSEDGGNSTIANAVPSGDELLFPGNFGEGRDGSLNAAIVDYAHGTIEPSCGGTCTYGNFAGVGTEFAPKGSVLDMTTATSIQFWMKGSAAGMTVRVEVATSDILDFGYYRIEAAVGTEWTQYTIDFSDFISFSQPSHADPVPFNPALVEKMQWQISAEDANPATGKIWIDDITVNGFVWTPPTVCTGIGAAGSGTGAVLADFDGTVASQNAIGQYSYAYNDAEGRVVGVGEFTDVFGGVTVDPIDPTVIDIAIAGNGAAATNGAFIEFQLGPSYAQDATTIQPFAGVGTRLADNLGLVYYNANLDGATGVSFDYMTSASIDWLTFEVHSNQDFGNAGIVHHCLAPGSAGTWRSASVPFGQLFLPDWEEVRNLPPALKALKVTHLEKFQWSFHGAPGTQASMAVDNIKLIGAAAITDVIQPNKRSRKNVQMQVTGKNLVFNFRESIRDVKVSLKNSKGSIVFQNTFTQLDDALELNTDYYASGIYFIELEAKELNGKSMVFHQTMPLLK